jgi:hypothetical protein
VILTWTWMNYEWDFEEISHLWDTADGIRSYKLANF